MAVHPFLTRIQPIDANSLRLLHPSGIERAEEVRAILERVAGEDVDLWRGMNRRIDRETARIVEIRDNEILLSTKNFEKVTGNQLFLNFTLDHQRYFFSTNLIEDGDSCIRAALPRVVHRAERRDRLRERPKGQQRARVTAAGTPEAVAEVADWSPEGLGLRIPRSSAPAVGQTVEIELLDGREPGRRVRGEVRNQTDSNNRPGWVRIGLDASATRRGSDVPAERFDPRARAGFERARERYALATAGLRLASERALARFRRRAPDVSLEIIDYENAEREKLRAILDSWGKPSEATTIVIPPAWGRTKETLMPLAHSIVAAFRQASRPVVVARFDGIRKRGESHQDPECRSPGKDHHRFTFSQGVRDIQATLDFLERSERFSADNVILVSFSAAAIEARRAVATDARIRGWVSVVGAPDLQSMMRIISGGIDYAMGLERGVRFGLQEILGVEVDMDFAGLDAFAHELVYLEDARRDMEQIRVPITWIRGQFDAWMDADRVRDALARGHTRNRRYIEVPTGHMLKTSREALDTFGLIVREISRMALGHEIQPVVPNLAELEARRRAERARLPDERSDVRAFWRDYLLGRDSMLGIELMTSITPYEQLMDAQVAALVLQPDSCIADLGSGTGAFPLHLARKGPFGQGVRIIELDYVREGLNRARERLAVFPSHRVPRVSYLESNLELRDELRIPLADASCDGVLAALFLSYVQHPDEALAEMMRVLRRGGRLVLSSLRPDADMSKLYMEGIAELRAGRARELFGPESERQIEPAARNYLNQASRLLDLEEKGVFRFWDAAALARAVREAGFRQIRVAESLGSPPQAVIVSATRP